jgi:dihydrofolate synthase/folylpolyglutamate synthase
MLRCLLPTANRVILTRAKINRALDPKKLEALAKKITPRVTIIADVSQALEYAIKRASPDDVICVAGSLYVVGEAKEALAGSGFKVHPATSSTESGAKVKG